MAIFNIRVDETLRRKISNLAKALGTTQTDLVKNAITDRITAHETAKAEASTAIPGWVPDGKCVALVRGAVAAVGDSVAEVVADAIAKFGDEPIHVARKGKPIRSIHYAFVAHATVKCWKYLTADGESFPIIPAKIIGKKELTTASSPDTASSLTLVSREVIDQAGLQPEAQETIYTAAGVVKMRTFRATIGLSTGNYDVRVASSDIPKDLPFQVLLGRNVLDLVELYALGKTKVVCIRDP